MTEKRLRYFDAFAGIGGFALGIQKAYEQLCDVDGSEDGGEQENQTYDERQGLLTKAREKARTKKRPASERPPDFLDQRPLCIGYSEIDKYAIQIYEKHYPSHKNYGDITKIDPTTLPDFDLFVGGFPCQAFSIAGKRLGFDDTRGTLFFDIARILKVKRPRNFILENVKGLLSHDNGRTFKTIISTLVELGYCVEWQVLNAKNFGVPQNRERVFIVGHLGGEPARKVFPIGENDGVPAERQGQISPTITQRYYKQGQSDPYITFEKDTKIRRLTPLECERLMAYPDGYTEGLSDTQRYKTLGNGIVSNVVEAVVKNLYENPHL